MDPTGFRYRTAALVGPWRSCPDEALADALRAQQVRLDDSGRVDWLVTGAIETGGLDRASPRR
ncbi:MAG: hypothetical protein ACXWUP_02925 [Allosphingosinicella sp.]